MKVYLVVSSVLLMLLSAACKQKAKPGIQAIAVKAFFPVNVATSKGIGDLDVMRKCARELILHRQQTKREDLFDLTYYYILPFALNQNDRREAPKEYEGTWIKFQKDYTYSYGQYNSDIGTGIYHYSPSDQTLIMLDEDQSIQPKMWQLLSNSEFYNFNGRPIKVVNENGTNKLLTDNLSNDRYLNTQEIIAHAPNGTQLLMKLSEEIPD